MQVEEKLSHLLDAVSASRAALLSCGRSGRRRTGWILWSSTLKPSSNFTVRFCLLLSSSTALHITDTKLLLTFSGSDTNDDKVLDEQELEALFTKEVRNVQKNTTAAAGHSLPPPDSNLSWFLLSWRRFTTPRMKKMT